jgi:hypothetical protein
LDPSSQISSDLIQASLFFSYHEAWIHGSEEERESLVGWVSDDEIWELGFKLQFALDPTSSLHPISSELIWSKLRFLSRSLDPWIGRRERAWLGIRWRDLRAWIQNFNLLWIQLALFISSHLISSHPSFSSYHEAWIDFRSWTRSWKNWAVIYFATFSHFLKKKKPKTKQKLLGYLLKKMDNFMEIFSYLFIYLLYKLKKGSAQGFFFFVFFLN